MNPINLLVRPTPHNKNIWTYDLSVDLPDGTFRIADCGVFSDEASAHANAKKNAQSLMATEFVKRDMPYIAVAIDDGDGGLFVTTYQGAANHLIEEIDVARRKGDKVKVTVSTQRKDDE